MKLSDLAIRNIKPGEKPVKHFDGHGLYLEVPPKGGMRWRYGYSFDGKRKLLALGVYPKVSLAQARLKHQEAWELVRRGIDPAQQRQSQKEAEKTAVRDSFEAVAHEWHSGQAPTWSESHATTVQARLRGKVLPAIGMRPVAEITAQEVLAVLRIVEARTPETAHKIMNIIGQIMRYGVQTGRCERDITADLRGALRPVVKSHFSAITNPKELSPVLKSLWTYWGGPQVMAALKLTPLLASRPGEVRQMEWSEIDFEAGEWNIPGEKMKMGENHLVPLSSQAVAILRELQQFIGNKRYVFGGRGERPMSENTVRAALITLGYTGDTVTAHGFRATFRTIGAEILGFREDLLEQQLAHAVRDTNGRAYNRTKFLPERKKMMQDWSDYLDQLRGQ